MKRLASAITLTIASTLATAADPQVRIDESLVLAYNSADVTTSTSQEETISSDKSLQVMHRTLDEVSASLGAELDARIAELMTSK
ncbi:hypothetical protein [Litorivivens sp.]|uniref:hypothetical protein n=1 Tax=Litorivivens sp. TaxID=2020868 RepID=UPI003568062F